MRRLTFFVGFLCCAVMSSCQEASMTGSGGKKQKKSADASDGTPNGVDQKNVRTPDIDDFEDTGWIGDDIREEFEKLFNPDPSTTIDNSGPDKPGSDDRGSKGSNGTPGIDTTTAKTGSPFNKDDQIFWMGCPEPVAKEYKLEGLKGMKVRLSGELCPSRPAKDKLSVLFVVDFSGSMFGNPFEGPNDPTEGDSCGRLKAAEALVKGYVSSDFKGVDVEVAMVGFSNTASLRIPFTAAKGIKSQLTHANWCGSDSPVAKTNYQAAFQEAQNALASVKGDKVVFFISDGSPTAGDRNPEADGLKAAQDLRTNVKDMDLNIIFLGYKNGDAKNPQGYLESIAGSKDDVTLVASADKLVDAVQSIGAGKVKISSSDVSASFSVGGKSVPLKLAEFRRNPKKLNRWIFATNVFELQGQPGKIVENTLEVSAKTSEGKKIQSKAVIQYLEK